MPVKVLQPPHRRRFREVIQDVWAALTGRTFVTMTVHCHTCAESFRVEAHQDLLYPLVFGRGGGEGMRFNSLGGYFPSVRARYDAHGAEYERLDPERFRMWQQKRVAWQSEIDPEQWPLGPGPRFPTAHE